nr:hypothetical protein [Saprospiraceae bacterium]
MTTHLANSHLPRIHPSTGNITAKSQIRILPLSFNNLMVALSVKGGIIFTKYLMIAGFSCPDWVICGD